MTDTGRQLAVAMGLAGLVHAAVAAAVFWVPPPPGAQAVGLSGVEVSLGPAGGAPGDVAAVAPTETTPPVETVETPPEVAPTEATPVEAVRPVEPEAVIPVETVETPPPSAEVEPPEQVVEAKPVVPPPPRRKPDPPKPEVVETPPDPAPPETVVAEELPEQTAAAPSVAGAAGKAGTLDSTEAGSSADASSGGGTPGASADYMSYLLAWLQKHKEYPTEARRRRQEGTALLYFEMDRDGRVRNFQLQRSSGHPVLDDEVLALIERAQPLPAPPPEVKGETVKLIVPVQFFLR